MLDPACGSATPAPLYLQAAGEKEKEVADCKLLVQQMLHMLKTLLFTVRRRLPARAHGGLWLHLQRPLPPTHASLTLVHRLAALACLQRTAFGR